LVVFDLYYTLGVAAHGIDVSRSTAEILVECLSDFEHAQDMCHRERRFLVDGEGLGGANGVFDLKWKG